MIQDCQNASRQPRSATATKTEPGTGPEREPGTSKATRREPETGRRIEKITKVAFKIGKFAAMGDRPERSQVTVHDVAGKILTPGLIDLHTHVCWGGHVVGIDAEQFARLSTLTTCADTGHAGPGNSARFRKHRIKPSQIRILACPHVSFAGGERSQE